MAKRDPARETALLTPDAVPARSNSTEVRTRVVNGAIARLMPSDSNRMGESNSAKPAREQLTLIRIFEEFRGRGYDGGYDALRRYARRWARQHGEATAAAYVPLS